MEEIKLTGKSSDIVSDNISKLKEIFPNIFTEDKIDFDKLKSDLGENIDDSNEKYNFSWPGKTQAIKESQKQSTGTLRPCKEESKNWDKTQNLYIEGDNLEVLKLLQKGYYNKIKCIYIDPPYNTGNDFIYNDDYKDNMENYLRISGQISDSHGNAIKLTTNTETSGRYHSNWLNMMYPRLKLARNLLTDDGIILISIDDNELENLKKLCDEIFGEENFLVSLIWNKQHSQQQGIFKRYHEYILVYGKNYQNIKNIQCKEGIIDAGALKKISVKNPASEFTFPPGVRFDAPDGTVLKGTFGDSEQVTVVEGDMIAKDGKLLEEVTLSAGWTQKNQMTEYFYGNNDVYDTKGQKVIEFYFNSSGKLKCLKEKSAITPSSLLQKYGMVSEQTKQLKLLMGGNYFDNPKPVKMIKEFASWFLNNDDIILDFFSGSATTAQSLFELNFEKNENNNFILVQIPEATDEQSEAFKDGYYTICEIGKERIRRAGDKLINESNNQDLDIGFKVFKLDSSNLEKWEPDFNNIQQSLIIDEIKNDRTNEDLVYEIMLKYGIDLTLPIEKHDNIYSIGYGALVICLDDNITKEITNRILEIVNDSSIARVVFKDSGFASDADKTNIKEILKTNHIDEFITI